MIITLWDFGGFMKRLIALAALFLFTAAAAHAEYLGGFIYSGMTTPGGGYTAASATKQGTASCRNIFFIVGVGDCSVKAAMRNGGIRSLAGYDVHRENILGVQIITTKAWGN